MNRTTRNTMLSLIAALALSTPVLANEQMEKLLAELDEARVALNSHRDNVQLLEGEVARIQNDIRKLKAEYAQTGDSSLKERIYWAINDLQRHQIRLADEQAAVMEWSQVVEDLMRQIADLDRAGEPSEPESGEKK